MLSLSNADPTKHQKIGIALDLAFMVLQNKCGVATCSWRWQRLEVAAQSVALSHAALHWQRPGQRPCSPSH